MRSRAASYGGMKTIGPGRSFGLRGGTAGVASGVTLLCSGCVMVGYRSGGGWFVWPGGLGLILLVLAILFFARRR